MQEQILIDDEKRITIKGATKVVSSTPNQSVVQTNKSTLIFSGTNIEVKKIDIENGEVVLEGSFNNLKLTQKGEKQPLFKRIFK